MVETVGEYEIVVAGQWREVVLRDVLVGERELRALRAAAATQQQREERGGRAVEGRHRHTQVRPGDELLDGVPRPGQRTLHLDGGARQGLPGVGEHQPPSIALGEWDGDRALQQSQLLGDRRGSHHQRLGGGGDAAQFAELPQDLQLSFVHPLSVVILQDPLRVSSLASEWKRCSVGGVPRPPH